MNRSNPAIKRIYADVKELQNHPSPRYFAAPLDDNLFEWHFTIRGPAGSDFEAGCYHGRILLPPEYPFKPPNIVFLTKNGRFEVGTKICLSISAYHPEHWQPAWGVRTMLEAIISFLPSEGAGAIGALDWTPRERRKLAEESLHFVCPICGPIKELLPDMPQEEATESTNLAGSSAARGDSIDPEIAAQIQQMHIHNLDTPSTAAVADSPVGAAESAYDKSQSESSAMMTSGFSIAAPLVPSSEDDTERIPFMPPQQEIAIKKATSGSSPVDGVITEPDRLPRRDHAPSPAPVQHRATAPEGPQPLDAVDVAILAVLVLLAMCIILTIIHIASSELSPRDNMDQSDL